MTGILTINSGQFHKEEVTAHRPLYCFRKIPVCCPLVQDTWHGMASIIVLSKEESDLDLDKLSLTPY